MSVPASISQHKVPRDYVGSAHIAGILGTPGAFGSQYSISRYLKYGESDLDEDNLPEPIEIGNLLEEHVAKLYSRKTGSSLFKWQPHFRLRDFNCVGCTPDAIFRTRTGSHRICDMKVVGDYRWTEVPEKYVVSSRYQHGVVFEEYDEGPLDNTIDLAVYHLPARRLEIYPVEADPKWAGNAIDYTIDWYRRFVMGDEIPPIDGSPATSDALKRIVASVGSTANIDFLAEEIERFDRLDEEYKEVGTLRDESRNKIIAAMGDAEIGIVNGEVRFTWKQQAGRDSIDTTALAADHPEIYKQYLRAGKPFRVPRSKKPKGKKS